MRQIVLFILLFIGITTVSYAQDSTSAVKPAGADTAVAKKDSAAKPKPEHSPRKASIRSAMIPGWGQAYNKKYWKIPIVYGALGTAAGFFVYNRKEYADARDAYRNMMDGDDTNNNLIKPKFQPVDPEAVRQYRIAVRQYVDYSVLAFVILWGLNVVDATVDGHLKAFEVNDNLSLHINPSYSPQTKQANLGLVLKLGK
ncbi:hypothetical protein ESA94_07080 [Lacibacter luteus]|uniref:DUF5683 domain-containing protein n=1 Tax=Lacibacter luteus TaxID=2508719 RepID=A0A4Q1CNS8_9BACT|nr:DUF5683 domain-containing protein [Lacibacter luteus]RXK62753.1 hypothetical protein ESA94_07080 [Lacibacter luteus]